MVEELLEVAVVAHPVAIRMDEVAVVGEAVDQGAVAVERGSVLGGERPGKREEKTARAHDRPSARSPIGRGSRMS